MKNIIAKTLFGGIISLEWLVHLNLISTNFGEKLSMRRDAQIFVNISYREMVIFCQKKVREPNWKTYF